MYLDLFKFKMSFYGLYHGKSPSFTTIWEKLFGFFFQASNKQIQVYYNNPLRAHVVDTDRTRKTLEEMSNVVDQNWSVFNWILWIWGSSWFDWFVICSLKETC